MNVVRDGIRQIGYELRAYFRAPDQVFFSFLFPIVMYGLFASIFSGQSADDAGVVPMSQYYLAAMITMAVLLSGTQNLAIDIAVEKHDGGLRRLGATPLRPVSFFIGKLGLTLLTCLVQIGLLVLVARVAFDVELPSDPAQWTTFAWVVPLGLVCFTALGIALSAVPRSSRSASAIVIPTVLLPQFISGIFLPFSILPAWLQTVSSVLPLTWLARGVRSALLPGAAEAAEPNGSWDLPLVAIMLGAWFVAGVVVSALTFRWARGRG